MAIGKDELAKAAKEWRGSVPAYQAALRLGIPKRTWENIEQGRGFPYPTLLMVGMQAIEPEDGK